MMRSESVLLHLIAAAYDAAVEPARWPAFLEQLAEALGGTLTAIFVHDFRSHDGTVVWTVRCDPEYLHSYGEYYHARNVYVTRRPEVVAVGRVLTGEEICPERDVLRSEIHADWMSPQDIFWTTGCALLKEGSSTAILTAMRPHRSAPFGADAVALQEALVPHLQNALQVQLRLQGLEHVRDAASAVLDRLPTGIILFDECGQPLTINARAQEILNDDDGLRLGLDGLCASDTSGTDALRRAVAQALETARGRGISGGSALRLARPSMKRPLSVLVASLPLGRLGIAGRTASVAVFVSDPERTPETSPEILARLYGLTPAESRVLAALAESKTPAQAAEDLEVSVQTIRAHLKRIFAATDTTSQSQLMQRLLRGPATLRQG